MGPSRGGGPSLVLTLKARLSKLVTRATFPFQHFQKRKGKKKHFGSYVYSLCTVQKHKRKTEKGQMECFTTTIDILFCGGEKRPSVQEQRPSNGTSKAICHVSLAFSNVGGNKPNKYAACLCSDALNIDDPVSSACTRHQVHALGCLSSNTRRGGRKRIAAMEIFAVLPQGKGWKGRCRLANGDLPPSSTR